jgi:thermosome
LPHCSLPQASYRSSNILESRTAGFIGGESGNPDNENGGRKMIGQTPVLILKEGTKREKGKGAQFNNITAARAIADSVRSTLGPRGMDKMLVDSMGDVVITNDGVTILKEIDVEHPAAKMLVEVAKTQDEECGDGTTTAVIVAGELLKKAEALIEQNVHPTVISGGFRSAAMKAREILEDVAIKVDPSDKDTLMDIARTAMISKSVSSSRDLLADVAVKAVSAVAEKREDGTWYVDDDNIQVVKKQGGSMDDTKMIAGIIVDKEAVHPAMPKHIEKAKIALVDAALEVKKTEIDAKIEITDPSQMRAFLDEEEHMLKKMVETVKKSGATVLFCQKGIDDLAQHYLAKEKIYAVRRVKKSDMEKLAKATGANLVTKLDDLKAEDLGIADHVDEQKIADDRMTFVTGCKNPKAVSVLIRGGTEHVVDEIERSLTDAVSVVSVAFEDGKLVTGGGSTAMELALKLRDYAASVGGREQIAIDAFASAMEVVPTALSENAGLDPIDVLIELRQAHKTGKKFAGVNVFTGKIVDMKKEKVLEPIRVGRQAISSATDAAVMILRIDDVIASKSGGAGGKGPKGPPGGDEGGLD